ncbi:uncharacterized protein LOC117644512 [Thrips palmi]|uniref:Uncharacterized protein LOC117644512 n=1 Tax=Thrips palmi TaxID=161013 RepID=A0A6P8ZM38_THRPL|nr:uncharacterized protein LOC117644512 [Thrips palmi]
MAPKTDIGVLACLALVLVASLKTAAEAADVTTVGPDVVVPGGLPMRVGDTRRVQVHVDYIAGPVLIGLCGEASCSTVKVAGYKKGVMSFSTWRVFVNTVAPWAQDDSEEVTPQAGPFMLFTKNETMVFEVSLRAADGVLAVSVEGQAAVTATIAPQPGETELKVLSQAGSAVLLGEGSAVPGQVTDGHAMAVGDQLAVHFCATGPGMATVGLCGAKSCSYVAVYGLDQDGRLRYGTAVSLLRNQLTGLSEWIEQPEWTNSSFVAGEQRVFVVSRCSEAEMQFWLDGAKADEAGAVVSVPLDKERAVLKVLGQAGNVVLRATGAKPFYCPEPATPATERPTSTAATAPPTTPATRSPSSSTPKTSGGASAFFKSPLLALLTAALVLLASVL